MDGGNENLAKDNQKLRNYSQISSFNRLVDRDSEQMSQLTAGGDEVLLKEDIEEDEIKNT